MSTNTVSCWKRLWRWITSNNLNESKVLSIIGKSEIEQLLQGLNSYKPLKKDQFGQLQNKYADQTRLLNVVQTLQNYVDIDAFQMWDVVNYYLCDISYGTPSNALKNVAFVDTRASFLLPNIWRFYHAERLYLLKLLQYIIEFKGDPQHTYCNQFTEICDQIKFDELKGSLLNQFSNVINAAPPFRKINKDFSDEHIRQEWAEFNLREQLTILQILLLISNETPFTDVDFKKMFDMFRKHSFGKSQSYMELLDDRHREQCMKIMYSEISLFLMVVDSSKIKDIASWIDNTKQMVEGEMSKLHLHQEYSAMLISWMLLTLHSDQHAKLFESQYQQFGATALKLHVFEFLHQLVTSSLYANDSKTSKVMKLRVFKLLNELCDKFDGDGSLGHQPGVIQLCTELLETPDIAERFWQLHSRSDNIGTVSLWNTALEYFPFNFHALSLLSGGLAKAGLASSLNLIEELDNLPVYTENYKPHSVPLTKLSVEYDDVIVGKDYFPLSTPQYKVSAGSRAAVMERKEGTLIHFRTPYSYWTILNDDIEKALDRKGQHNFNINMVLDRVLDGTKLLKKLLNSLGDSCEVPKGLMAPSEGVFDVMVRFMRTEPPPLPLLVACLEVSSALVSHYPKEIHSRVVRMGLLPRGGAGAAAGAGAVGAYLVALEQPAGRYRLLQAYLRMLSAFLKAPKDERITSEILSPGVVFILREVFPNLGGWRYESAADRRRVLADCVDLLFVLLQQSKTLSDTDLKLQHTAVYSFLSVENAVELLKIVTIGNEQTERLMYDEPSWVSGSGIEYLNTLQRCLALLLFILRLKPRVVNTNDLTPLEQMIFAQNKQKDPLKVVPKITSYINHVFNGHLSVLSCRLLTRFASDFQMSLFTCLDMTAYQVRVMFLERLRDKHETPQVKIAILEFVTTCIGKQPGLTEAFFKLRHVKETKDENKSNIDEDGDDAEGVLSFMATYLDVVKSNTAMLYNPLLGCIMALFHALWKNNMQMLVKELRVNDKFWEHLTSPLFFKIEPGLKAYAQIFNILGMELFVERDKIEPAMKAILETFFDTDKQHLDNWIQFIYSFEGRQDEEEEIDRVPPWLGLLTSWKDFTMIFCKCLPINLNIAHKAKMVAPCMKALLYELEDMTDGRLVTILAELYVIMLANWKDDCFDNRKANVKQIDALLTNTAVVYDSLHIRAKRAILSISTVAISSLDYEIKANSTLAQSIIRSVTNINSLELGHLFDDIKEELKADAELKEHEKIPPIVLSLAMLEQCLELYDDMFSGLGQWFQSTRFINKLLCCLQTSLHNRRHYYTSLATLRCLTAYSRGPFSKDLLLSDVDQFLWLPLLPPKIDDNGGKGTWKAIEWWKVYAYSLDFISMMVMKHGQFFVSDAITFVGVHLEYLIESVLLPRQVINMDSLNLCASTLNLVVQLVKYESRWRIENITSLVEIMRSISACLCQCVSLCLRTRRASDVSAAPPPSPPAAPFSPAPASPAAPPTSQGGHAHGHSSHLPTLLNRILEIQHMATLCLLSFSPDLLSLLADPGLDLERWQPLVELHGTHDAFPQLTFGTLLSAISMLTKSLNHAYQSEEAGGSRSPRGRRRCSCGSPGEARRAARSESLTSISSGASAAWTLHSSRRLVAGALEAALTLLASQALLTVRDPRVPTRHKQQVRRELSSELTVFHEFVRRRILCAAHARPHLVRNKLGAWPLLADEEEVARIQEATHDRYPDRPPPPPPPKRSATDSMREYILRKHYLDKCAQTPVKGPPSPVSHSTPHSSPPPTPSTPATPSTADKKKEASRSLKRVSWAETTTDSDAEEITELEPEPAYSNLTDVQINNDEDYFHFMSVVFLYVCQTDL